MCGWLCPGASSVGITWPSLGSHGSLRPHALRRHAATNGVTGCEHMPSDYLRVRLAEAPAMVRSASCDVGLVPVLLFLPLTACVVLVLLRFGVLSLAILLDADVLCSCWLLAGSFQTVRAVQGPSPAAPHHRRRHHRHNPPTSPPHPPQHIHHDGAGVFGVEYKPNRQVQPRWCIAEEVQP